MYLRGTRYKTECGRGRTKTNEDRVCTIDDEDDEEGRLFDVRAFSWFLFIMEEEDGSTGDLSCFSEHEEGED